MTRAEVAWLVWWRMRGWPWRMSAKRLLEAPEVAWEKFGWLKGVGKNTDYYFVRRSNRSDWVTGWAGPDDVDQQDRQAHSSFQAAKLRLVNLIGVVEYGT